MMKKLKAWLRARLRLFLGIESQWAEFSAEREAQDGKNNEAQGYLRFLNEQLNVTITQTNQNTGAIRTLHRINPPFAKACRLEREKMLKRVHDQRQEEAAKNAQQPQEN